MTRDPLPAAARVLDLAALQAALAPARAAGQRIVFTNGCFDLVHAGHAALLELAAAEGDLLVVGLNSDASVSRLKGPTRPIVPQAARALLVAALRPVDFVTLFEEETPLELIAALRPDVLVKGADYPLEGIVGRDLVERGGGRVVRMPLVEGFSTSALLRRLADAGAGGEPPRGRGDVPGT